MKEKLYTYILISTIIIVSGIFISYEISNEPVLVPSEEKKQVTEKTFEKLLSWIDKETFNDSKYGTSSKVLTFRTASNSKVELYVTEGEFNDSSIDPIDNWLKLLSNKPTLLLNSPDEKYQCLSGINGQVCRGCNISELETPTTLGKTAIVDCNGKLSKNMNISNVAQAVVINMGSRFKDSISYEEYITSSDIWKSNLKSALHSFFDNHNLNYRYKNEPINFIIPEIGTGIGGLTKDIFYNYFFSELKNIISNPIYKKWPKKIIIQVYRGDILKKGGDKTRYLLADELYDLFVELKKNSFRKQENINSLYGIMGIAVMLLIIIIILTKKSLPNFLTINSNRLLQSVIGTFILSIGSIAIIHKIFPVSFLEQQSNPIHILIGVISVPFSLLILNAKESTKKTS